MNSIERALSAAIASGCAPSAIRPAFAASSTVLPPANSAPASASVLLLGTT